MSEKLIKLQNLRRALLTEEQRMEQLVDLSFSLKWYQWIQKYQVHNAIVAQDFILIDLLDQYWSLAKESAS